MKTLMEIWNELKPGQMMCIADAHDYFTDADGDLRYRFTGPMTESRVQACQNRRVLSMFKPFNENNIYCVTTRGAGGGET